MVKNTDYNIVCVAYRGYSGSEGVPTEKGLKLDGIAILDYVMNMKQIDTSKVIVFGRSLGGAVAINTLSHTRHTVAGAIIENTFTSIPDMVDVLFPPVAFLKMIVLRNFWYSDQEIKRVKAPMLFIKAVNDELIPATQMNQLYSNISPSVTKYLYEIERAGHNGSWMMDKHNYHSEITKFVT